MDIKNASKKVLSQLSKVLNKLTEEEYSRSIEILSGATIGQHIRHTLEFYTCLQEGTLIGVVNYDKRNRDLELETIPDHANNVLQSLFRFIDEINDERIELEVNYNLHEDQIQRVPSNIDRELCYNIEHAIHHMALIKIGLRVISPEIQLPEGFGVAVSTLRYLKENQEA